MGISTLLFMIWNDFAIYWIHRPQHHPSVYKYIHKPYHKWDRFAPRASPGPFALNPEDPRPTSAASGLLPRRHAPAGPTRVIRSPPVRQLLREYDYPASAVAMIMGAAARHRRREARPVADRSPGRQRADPMVKDTRLSTKPGRPANWADRLRHQPRRMNKDGGDPPSPHAGSAPGCRPAGRRAGIAWAESSP